MQDTVDFVTVSRVGNVITVEAFGGDGDPQTLDDKAVTGVVASRDGLITDMQVLGGYPLVKKGDVVARGQQLVTAVTPPTTEQGLGHIGHGWGRITAQTSRAGDLGAAAGAHKKTLYREEKDPVCAGDLWKAM